MTQPLVINVARARPIKGWRKNLTVFVTAANQREESLDHVILYGPPGLGKTTLSTIISKEMNVNIKISSGPILDKSGDFNFCFIISRICF